MQNIPFETLIKSNGVKTAGRWYPQSVERYKSSINLNISVDNASALRSNLAYNLQYIEFLEKEISELKLSDVIYTMLAKTYVITGMSILEGVFSNIIKSNGWWKTSDLESLGIVQANEKNFNGQSYVVKTELLRKSERYDLQMNLDDMIKVLNHHHEALDIDHLVYPALKHLKGFRNRIHLQKLDGQHDHDYNAFDYKVKKEMGKILYTILTSSTITSQPYTFDFLKNNLD